MKDDANIWLLLLAAASPILSALIAVGGVVATIMFTNRRERDRQGHERLLKDAELEAARQARLRDERIASYRKLLRATATAHWDREAVGQLSEAYTEILLLADSAGVVLTANEVWVLYDRTREIGKSMTRTQKQDPAGDFLKALTLAENARGDFLELALKEFGVERPDPEA